MKEVTKLKRNGQNDRDVVFCLVRIIDQIWQTHPFREGNIRSVIVFAVLFAKSLGFVVEHKLFQAHSAYVRSTHIWSSQGMYAKYEYLELIFFDAILHDEKAPDKADLSSAGKYEKIGDYLVKDYKERPHEYQDFVAVRTGARNNERTKPVRCEGRSDGQDYPEEGSAYRQADGRDCSAAVDEEQLPTPWNKSDA